LGEVIYIVEKRFTSTHEVEELNISVLRRIHLAKIYKCEIITPVYELEQIFGCRKLRVMAYGVNAIFSNISVISGQ
jgi:hypothetical protein